MISIPPGSGRCGAASAAHAAVRQTTSPKPNRVAWWLSALALCAAVPAIAQDDPSESRAWQFSGPQDLAAQAAARDLIERRRGGVFAAPVYHTTIDRQYNCAVSASATGNSGVQSALANSPTTSGAASSATGNSNASSATGDRSNATIGNGQENGGAVGAVLNGATTTSVTGSPVQVLNSSQSNSGDQRASVSGASACAFGALN